MDDIHVDGNQIYLGNDKPSQSRWQDHHKKAADIHSSSNMRQGCRCKDWTNANPARTVIAKGTSGNEAAHGSYTQSIYGVQPDGQQFLIANVTSSKNLPYSYPLSSKNGYSPAVPDVTVGYESANGNIYVPYI